MTVQVMLYVPSECKARVIEQVYNVETDSWSDIRVHDVRPSTDEQLYAYKKRRVIIQEI